MTMSAVKRLGDVTKCPACGSEVAAGAYCCPRCRNYFCFRCRARVLGGDTQLQCVNQECDYYGKLVCGACASGHEKEEAPSVYEEPEDGYWPAWLLVVVVAFAILWYYLTFGWAAGIAIATFVLAGYVLQRAGLNLFGRKRVVAQPRKSSFHTCLNCQQRMKELADGLQR